MKTKVIPYIVFLSAVPVVAFSQSGSMPLEPPSNPWYSSIWVWMVVAFLFILIIGVIVRGDDRMDA